MRRGLPLLIALLVVALTGFSTNGQSVIAGVPDTAPIFLWVRGDLWRVNPLDLNSAPVQVTQNGTISGPALSPDGLNIAYKVAAPVGLAALDRVQGAPGGIASFDLPADIYVLNVGSGTSQEIVGQPDNASLLVEGTPDNALIRSAPAWSPDGTSLIWTEMAFGSRDSELVVLNGRTSSGIRLFTGLPATTNPPQIAIAPSLATDGQTFMIVAWVTDDTGVTTIGAYASDGAWASIHALPSGESSVEQIAIVEMGDTQQVAVLYSSGDWALYPDFQAGNLAPYRDQHPEGPFMYAHGNPAQTFGISFGYLGDTGFFWEAFDPFDPQAASVAFPGAPGRITIAPSGRAIAFLGFPDYGSAAIYRDGELLPIPNTGSGTDKLSVGAILWGSAAWRENRFDL
ncbi:MAG: hypothetical protein U0670_24155 [Anaerolineae bacterium]